MERLIWPIMCELIMREVSPMAIQEEGLQIKTWRNGYMAKMKERELTGVSVRLHRAQGKAIYS